MGCSLACTRSEGPSDGWLVFGVALLLAGLGAAGCAQSRPPAAYTPQVRELTLTTVPLLTKELQKIYPFLRQDFAPGGVLQGKEVYGFSPSTLVVVEGDTIHFTLVNPEDDEHSFSLPDCTDDDRESFVLPDCGVRLPALEYIRGGLIDGNGPGPRRRVRLLSRVKRQGT